ncbi:E3 ubiquitin-protein ligase DTX3L [Bagarius yarrelli]|uniref:E3 ubiquitin-protein ligase n=1 Tax=Bagarius yarrelli TaxID=175774 RepID=A0A556VXF6_BAGYA|nr:E3 ubiquitin-protein ligase DTX3L [Bagarius yarrelli]
MNGLIAGVSAEMNEPMDVCDIEPMDTSSASHENPEKHPTSSDKADTQPSAPPDVVVVHVKVDWTEELPERWRFHLEKALQTWCNSEAKDKGSVKIVQMLDGERTAEVEITPSSALKNIKTATLTFKNLDRTANVLFQKVRKPENKSSDLTMTENLTTLKVKDVEVPSKLLTDAEMNGASAPLTLPAFLYCYLSQVYKEEMKNIEKNFGVKIKEETCVSIFDENQRKDSDSVRRATEAFTELYQNSTKKLKALSIPSTDTKFDMMKKRLCYFAGQENKIMLNISANEYRMFGPQDVTSVLDTQLSLIGGAKVTSTSFMSNSNPESTWSSQSLHMVLKDVASRIEMAEAHWELLRSAFKEQFLEIQKKFGVEFQGEPGQGLVTVSARTKNANQVNLEVHALNALTHLYQKVVTSAPGCDLTDASYNKTSQQGRQEVLAQHTDIQEEQRKENFRLFGHLVPTVDKIEKVWDGAHGIDWKAEPIDINQEISDKTKANDKEEESEDNCPICLDTFTQKQKLSCSHEFCEDCLKHSIQSSGEICPICKQIFGILQGNQPEGTIQVSWISRNLPGYSGYGTIQIHYIIPSGIQTSAHPNPGQHYHGTSRTAYLPDNAEGKHVLELLKRAFEQKLIFTVGMSRTTGAENSVVWNDIHHKTNTHGGPQK